MIDKPTQTQRSQDSLSYVWWFIKWSLCIYIDNEQQFTFEEEEHQHEKKNKDDHK